MPEASRTPAEGTVWKGRQTLENKMLNLTSKSSSVTFGTKPRTQTTPFLPSESKKTWQNNQPQAKLGALNDEKRETGNPAVPGRFFSSWSALLCRGTPFLEQKGGSLFSSAPASLTLQSLVSRHLSLLCVTMDETSGSLRAEGSERWKSHSQFSEFLTLKKLFSLFLKRDLAQIL